MALMPTFWGLSDMMCVCCGGVFWVEEKRGVVACVYFSRADAVCEGQREQCNWQGGVWLSKKGEVSPGGRDLVDAKGEFEMEMGMKTGEGEREEEKDGMGIIIIQHQALAIWGDFGSSRCASAK
jgi:hypothetical protein